MAKRESAKKQKVDLENILDHNLYSEEEMEKVESDRIQKLTSNYVMEAAKRNAISSMITKYYKNLLRTQPGNLIKDPKLLKVIEEAQALENADEEIRNTGIITFITLNPRPFLGAEDLVAFYKLFKKALTKKWIDGYIYCFDQRLSELPNLYTEDGRPDADALNLAIPTLGIHVHMVVRSFGKKKPSEITREFMSTMAGYFGNPKHIDVKRCTLGKEQGAIDYVCLLKKDEKQEIVAATKEFHTHFADIFMEPIKFNNWLDYEQSG